MNLVKCFVRDVNLIFGGIMIRASLLVAPVLLFVGCVDIPGPVNSEVIPHDSPFSVKQPEPHVGSVEPEFPIEATGPKVQFLSPQNGAVFESTAPVVLRLSGADGGPIVACSVKVGFNAAFWLPTETNWTDVAVPVTLPFGISTISVVAVGPSGATATAEIEVERLTHTTDPAPTVTITSPTNSSVVSDCNVNVVGTAEPTTTTSKVEIDLPQFPEFSPIIPFTFDGFSQFSVPIELPPGKTTVIRASVFDLGGNIADETTIDVHCSAPADIVPPVIVFESGLGDSVTDVGVVTVSGTATDNLGISDVLVRVGDGPFVPANTKAGTGANSTEFDIVVTLNPGQNEIVAIAYDLVKNTAVVSTEMQYVPDSGYDTPITHTLSVLEPEFPTVTMTLDKSFLKKAFPGDTGASITLLELDPLPMLGEALQWIVNQCIANGKTVSCPSGWTAAEVNMWKLLTMTAQSADVSGTDFENLQEVADVLSSYVNKTTGEPLLQDFATLLAMTLGVDADENVIAIDAIAQAIASTLLASHPNTQNGKIPVTLQDGLEDMATLGKRFGPVGEHPGFIPKGANPSAKVMLDHFAITLTGISNLVYQDGINLSTGTKGQMALVTEGYSDVLQLDFLDEKTFSIVGLAQQPTVDLPFFMKEHAGELTPSMTPGNPKTTSENFTKAKPWTLEHVVAEAAYLVFDDYLAGCDLCTEQSGLQPLLWEIPGIEKGENDLAEIVVGMSGISTNGTISKHFPPLSPNPPGWMRVWVGGGYGLPEEIQAQKLDLWNVGYLWDILVSVAEQRLHDGVDVGTDVEVHFALKDIPVGLTGEQLEAAVKEGMELQKSEITKLMLGNYGVNSDPIDVFLTKNDDKKLVLVQVVETDPLPAMMIQALPYVTTGFFEDSSLTTPVVDPPVDGRPSLLLPADHVRIAYTVDLVGCVVRIEAQVSGDNEAVVTTRREVQCEP